MSERENNMSVSQNELSNKIQNNTMFNEADKHDQLLRFNTHKINMNNHHLSGWFKHAVEDENILLLEAILDHLDVPDNMTIKERVCYYQLLGN